MWKADNWKDYEVLDTGNGEKLERWGEYLLVRPDPQVICCLLYTSTTATQYSRVPLPEPIRVSAGFAVTGLSGKILIHTLPVRFV